MSNGTTAPTSPETKPAKESFPDLTGTSFVGVEVINAALDEARSTESTPKEVIARWAALGMQTELQSSST